MIHVKANVRHVYDSYNNHSTYFDVIIGKTFPFKLPDAIDAITITGPNGKLPFVKKDFTYLPHNRDFWIKFPGTPEVGTRMVDVTEGKTKRDWAIFIEKIAYRYESVERITLVMDNLNTHNPGSLYETFPPEKAKALYDRAVPEPPDIGY